MINTSNEYKSIVANHDIAPCFTAKTDITLADGTILNVTEKDIVVKGAKLNDSTSPSNVFQIGSAIINQYTLMLNNIEGKFKDYDFTDAVIIPYAGLKLSATTEWLKKGVYTVDEPTVTSSIINLIALDNMAKFDTPFSNVAISFPCTQLEFLQAVCLHCGVVLATISFLNDDFVVTRRPSDEATTCREIVSYIAQNSGNFAKVNTDGALELKWYDYEAFKSSDNLDGGTFDSNTPYSSGDSADGGNFIDFNNGDNINGGTFLDMKRYHHIYALGQATIGTDDVVITGIQVKAQGTESDYGETILYGSTGYVIEITNPLITENTASIIANSVGAKIVGMRFRTCSISALADPSRVAGDVAYLSDRKGNSYQILITNLTYQIGVNDSISCDAETTSKKKSVRYDAATKAIIETYKNTQEKLTAYDLAMKQLNSLMANAMGYYPTSVKQADGSQIDYMHDKPTLAESQIVWKKTIDGFAVSTNGGTTWTTGITADGNIIAKTLSVIGINAEWIKVLTNFTVGSYFSVNKFGELIATRGKIAGFNFTEDGFTSPNMELLNDETNPVIWVRSKNNLEHANYEGALTFLRNKKVKTSGGATRKTVRLDTRQDWNLHGLELVEEDMSSANENDAAITELKNTRYTVYGIDALAPFGQAPQGFSINCNFGSIGFFDGIVVLSDNFGNSLTMTQYYTELSSSTGARITMQDVGTNIYNSNGVFANGRRLDQENSGLTLLQEQINSIKLDISNIKTRIGMTT